MSGLKVVKVFEAKNASLELSELSEEANENPVDFQKFIIIHYGDRPDGEYFVSSRAHGCNELEAIGLLELGKVYMGV